MTLQTSPKGQVTEGAVKEIIRKRKVTLRGSRDKEKTMKITV